MSTLRVIAGTAARRKLHTPRSAHVRPTTDRVKESLFNILGESIAGAHFLDLYAGSGSVGIEALSRGAAHATFIDRYPAALRCIRDNLETLGLEGEIIRARLPTALRHLAPKGAPFDLLFLDPPYQSDLAATTLAALADRPELLSPRCELIAQHDSHRAPPEEVGLLHRTDRRVIGSTVLTWFAR